MRNRQKNARRYRTVDTSGDRNFFEGQELPCTSYSRKLPRTFRYSTQTLIARCHIASIPHLLFRELWRRREGEKRNGEPTTLTKGAFLRRAKLKAGGRNVLAEGSSPWSCAEVSAISASTEIGSSIEKRKRTERPRGEIRAHRLEHLTRLA